MSIPSTIYRLWRQTHSWSIDSIGRDAIHHLFIEPREGRAVATDGKALIVATWPKNGDTAPATLLHRDAARALATAPLPRIPEDYVSQSNPRDYPDWQLGLQMAEGPGMTIRIDPARLKRLLDVMMQVAPGTKTIEVKVIAPDKPVRFRMSSATSETPIDLDAIIMPLVE